MMSSDRILKADEGGSIDFVVYGYMNRGEHEGQWVSAYAIMTV